METENQNDVKKLIGDNYTHKTSKWEHFMKLSYRKFNKQKHTFGFFFPTGQNCSVQLHSKFWMSKA